MPAVVVGAALSAVAAGSTFTLAAGLSIGFSLSSFAGSLILGGLSYALTPKPKKPPIPDLKAASSTVAVRQSDLTRQRVYGHTRIVRGYAHMQGKDVNGELHLITMLCEGELRAINEIWVNDYCIPPDWIDGSGNVTQGRYQGKLVIRKHLGSPTQLADSLAVTNLTDWTNDHRLQGIAYLYLILTKDQDVYPTGVPNFTAIVEGPTLYDPRTATNLWTTNIALFANDYIKSDEYGFAAFDDDVDDDNISAQANICDEMVQIQNKNFTVASVDTATDIITLNANDAEMLELQYGDRVQISTSGGTLPGGLSALTNYFVIPYQLKTTPRIKLASSLANALAGTAINLTSAGSNLTITQNAEPRYHGSGSFDTETPLSENLNNIVTSMAGRAVNVGGRWTLLAGAWRTPAMSYGIGDMRGAMGLKNAQSMSDAYNVVNGLFISQLSQYQSTNYPSARYQDFIDDNNGVEAPKELNLAYCTRPTAAQRIAKIELFRGQQEIVFTAPFSMKALQSQPGDVVSLTVANLGWTNKYFEVTEFSFDVNNGALQTTMTLRETAQEIYTWADTEYLGYDPAPNTDLTDPFSVQVPTGVSFDSIGITTMAGDTVYQLTLEWTLHPDAFVREFGDFELQFKRSDEVDYRPSFFVDGSLTNTVVTTATVGETYDIRIRARNNLGVRSNWVTLLGVAVGGSGGIDRTMDWRYFFEIQDRFLDWGAWTGSVTDTDDWGDWN